MILVERIGHVLLWFVHADDMQDFVLEIAQPAIARIGHDLAQPHRCRRVIARVDKDDLVEILRQVVRGTHKINGFANRPVFRH